MLLKEDTTTHTSTHSRAPNVYWSQTERTWPFTGLPFIVKVRAKAQQVPVMSPQSLQQGCRGRPSWIVL